MKKEYKIDGLVVDLEVVHILRDKGVLRGMKTHEDPSGLYSHEVENLFTKINNWNKRVADIVIEHGHEVDKFLKEANRDARLIEYQKEAIEAQRQTIDAMGITIESLKKELDDVRNAAMIEFHRHEQRVYELKESMKGGAR